MVEPRMVEPRRVEPRTQKNGPRRVELRRVGGPKFRAFFPLPPQFSFILPSLGRLLVEFRWCLERRGLEMFTFGVLRLSKTIVI